MMIAFLDVDYRSDGAVAACVTANNWQDAQATAEHLARIPDVAEYEPGSFYKRELPCLLTVLNELTSLPQLIVVDGYVWLADEKSPGLGARLYEALGKTIP